MQTIEQLRSGKLSGAHQIKLSCGLTSFPTELLDLADSLEVLDLSDNKLSSLPEEFTKLSRLKILFLSGNEFTEFPTVLGECTNLDIIGFKANKIARIAEGSMPSSIRWLILTNNRFTQLPDSIGKCINLQKCMLAGNQLTELPEAMINCKKLELLRISANRFERIPEWLFSLPRLAWLALAGNPMMKNYVQNNLPEISGSEFEIEQLLGEGASGVISKARWQKMDKEVAVKVFKGEVTSDGFPEDEMNACIAAGFHPNLVRVLGKLKVHPQRKQGLVFDLIEPSFTNLGGPPDFKTCTRDTFKEGTVFSLQQMLQIASGIASVLTHLHARGIVHGDLYAHNILIDDQANPLLSDFGAAFIFNRNMENFAALERIEVRAFGCLLDDLLARIDAKDKSFSTTTMLMKLQEACMQEIVMLRPDFATIHHQIKNMIDVQ